ncbi:MULTISPECIES: AsmA-like C-terminal region-containing protein [unclassified Aureimonas]|uniref:AsmA-like C-terminal region-containing protein n=1 Tax=unclassified Aureimonas TaxID=2615206 RepID=UPI0006FAE8D4|nr:MULTISPECIES: AsmA-like C-terminal region-containing protein [unclassified Aureimonas]KQT52866.1 hypothetical protein ASG62_13170 [Aureimonas sp. Leaf427]KQT80325.1 hypothetical protein ASG54_07020 [Aureimonas sp. Leaf460]
MVALLGALIAPLFIDWTAYRTDFEREAGSILGRQVTVRGEASARLLPFPSVTFTDVVVVGARPEDAPLLAVDHFRMDAELAPYLSGEIRIFSMELQRPHLTVPIETSGRIPALGGTAGLAGRATVILEKVAIEEGRVTIEDRAAGRTQDLNGLNAELSARSLAGPFAGTGTFQMGGAPYEVLLSSGAVQPEGGLPLRLTLDAKTLDAEIVLDGTAHGDPASPRFEGTIRLSSPLPPPPNTGAAPKPATGSPASILPPMVLTSKLVASPSAVSFEDTRIATGGRDRPYILTGGGRLALGAAPRFDLALEGEQVDVDAVANGTEPGLGNSVRQATSFEQRLEAARRVLSAVPRPTIPGTVKLSLPIVLVGDTTIRDVAFGATPAPDGWRVEGLSAELPGRTRLEATGTLGLEPLNFSGDLLLASRQPSGFSDWLTGGVDPALRRLGQAGLSAKVALTAERQSFDDLELDIGGETVTGRLDRGADGLTADLSAGGVDLDALLALSRLFSQPNTAGFSPTSRFALKLGAGPVRSSGAAAERIDADLSFDGHTLAVNRMAVADLAGADFAVSGTLTGLDTEAGGSLSVNLSTADPTRLTAFLRTRLPQSPALAVLEEHASTLAPLAIRGTVATVTEAPGEKPTLRIQLDGKAAATDVTLQVALGNGIYAKGTSGRFGLEAGLSSPDPAALLGQLGLDTIATGPPAPLGLKLQLSAGATGPVAASASLDAPGSSAAAEGTFDVTTAGIASAEFGVGAKSEDLSPWLTALAIEAGQSRTEALPFSLDGHLSWFQGDWTLKGLTAEIADSALRGELRKTTDGPVTGRIEATSLSVPWLATLVTGRSPERSDGASPWAAEGFGTPLLPPIETALDLNVGALDLGRGAVVADAAAALETGPARIALENISGSIAGGYLRGGVSLQNANGVAGLSADMDFSGLDIGNILSRGGGATEGLTDAELRAIFRDSGVTIPGTAPSDAADAGTDGAGQEPWPDAADPSSAGTPEGADPAEQAPDGDAEDVSSGAEVADAPAAGTLDATLKLEASGQSYPALIASLAGAGRASIDSGSIAGIPTGLLPKVLTSADAEGFEPQAGRVAGLVAEAAKGASYPIGLAETEIAIAGGVARISPITAETTGEALTLSGTVDLRRETIDAGLRLALQAGEEAVAGADPAVAYTLDGPLSAPVFRTDAQPLAAYLAARAIEREEARVQAIQEQLQERLRLRREARFDRAREAERTARAEAAAAAEEARRRSEEARAATQAPEPAQTETPQDEEIRRREAVEAARRQMEANPPPAPVVPAPTPAPEAASPAAPRNQPRAETRPALPRQLDLTPPIAPAPAPPTPSEPFPSLPGVNDPLKF